MSTREMWADEMTEKVASLTARAEKAEAEVMSLRTALFAAEASGRVLWVDHSRQCGDNDPNDRHSCTIERGHSGAHVAIDPMFFNGVLAAWPVKA
jgi:hypothetical protein